MWAFQAMARPPYGWLWKMHKIGRHDNWSVRSVWMPALSPGDDLRMWPWELPSPDVDWAMCSLPGGPWTVVVQGVHQGPVLTLIVVQDWEFYWCECGHMDLGHPASGCVECGFDTRGIDTIRLPGCPTFLPRATDAQPTPSWQMCPQKDLERSKASLIAIISAKLREQLPKMFPSRKVPKKVIHGKRIDTIIICDDVLDDTIPAVSNSKGRRIVKDWWDKRVKP